MIDFKKNIYRTTAGLDFFTPEWNPVGQYCVQDGGEPVAPKLDYSVTGTGGTANGFSLTDLTTSTNIIYVLGVNASGSQNLVTGHQYQLSTFATSSIETDTAHCDLSVDSTDLITEITTNVFYDTETATSAAILVEYIFVAADNILLTAIGNSFVAEI
jgi:hypothetical protein